MSDGHPGPDPRPISPPAPRAPGLDAVRAAWTLARDAGVTSLLAALVLFGAVGAFVWLQITTESARRATVQLAQLEAGVQQINALEWRLSAERAVSPELEWSMSRARARVATLIAELPADVGDDPAVERVVAAYRVYVRAVDHEMDLLRLEQVAEADRFDRDVADPMFEALLSAIVQSGRGFSERARHAGAIALQGSIAAALLALLAMAVLGSRATRSQRRAQAAEARGRAWQASDRVLRELFETHPEPMWVADAESDHLLAANPAAAQLYGYDPSAFLRLRVMDVCERGLRAADLRLSAGGRPGLNPIGEREHRRRDGSALHVEMDVLALVHDGHPAVLALVRDRTAEHRLASRVREAQRMETLGRLANGVAHDFNNLVTAIVGYTQLLLNDLQGPNSAGPRAHAQEIWKSARRATALTRQLLAFGRPSPGGLESLDVGQLARELQPMLARLLGEDVALGVRVASGTWSVRGDRGQLEQILVNLALDVREGLGNGGRMTLAVDGVAIDAANAARLGAQAPGEYVGIVIGAESAMLNATVSRPLAFSPGSARTEDGGLTLVTGQIAALGGVLELQSAANDGPFRVLLPRDGAVVSFAAPPKLRVETPRAERATILLVEDDAAVRDMTRQVLEARGHHVLQAANAEQALAVARPHPGTIDLMITDVVMPGANGRQLAERLVEERPELKVLYISGYTEDLALRQMVDEGHLEFLAKPFQIEALEERVDSLLAARKAA